MENALLWATAVGSAVTGLATIALVFVAWRTLGGARDQLTVIKDDSQRSARPYVYVEVVSGLHGPGHWDLVIENVGRTMARNVHVEAPSIPVTGPADYVSGPLGSFLATPMDLPPSAHRRVMWRNEPTEDWADDEAGAPMNAVLHVSYEGDDGSIFHDSFTFRLFDYRAASPSPFEGKTSGDRDPLKDINYALRTLNVHVGSMRR